jgi:hypothetical protein
MSTWFEPLVIAAVKFQDLGLSIEQGVEYDSFMLNGHRYKMGGLRQVSSGFHDVIMGHDLNIFCDSHAFEGIYVGLGVSEHDDCMRYGGQNIYSSLLEPDRIAPALTRATEKILAAFGAEAARKVSLYVVVHISD